MFDTIRHVVLIATGTTLLNLGAPPPPVQAESTLLNWPSRVIFQDVPQQQRSVVTAVSIRPGGWVAAAGDDHVIRVWDADSGRRLQTLVGHADWIRTLSYSPDGKFLVSAGNDRHIILWDAETGQKIRAIGHHDQAVSVTAHSHNGRWLAAAGFERSLHIYDLATARPAQRLECPCVDMRALCFSVDDRVLIAGGRNGRIRVWDLESRQKLRDLPAHRQRIRTLACSPDGRHFVSAGEDRRIGVWSLDGTADDYLLATAPAKVLSLVFLGNDRIATAGSDNVIRVWSLSSREEMGHVGGHTGSVVALDFRDGMLVSGSYDTSVRVWETSEDAANTTASRPASDIQGR